MFSLLVDSVFPMGPIADVAPPYPIIIGAGAFVFVASRAIHFNFFHRIAISAAIHPKQKPVKELKIICTFSWLVTLPPPTRDDAEDALG